MCSFNPLISFWHRPAACILLGLVLLHSACTHTSATLSHRSTSTQEKSSTLSADDKILYRHALESLQNKQPKGTLQTFKSLQKDYPDFVGAWLGESDLYLQQRQWGQALSVLKQAQTINPDVASLYTRQAYCYRQLGQFDEAELAYQQALRLNADYALAHYNYAILLDLYLQQAQEAITHFAHYQRLHTTPDPQVDKWLKELKRRVAKPLAQNPDAAPLP
jgi:tetratricopeptide (TPR) repeat protein